MVEFIDKPIQKRGRPINGSQPAGPSTIIKSAINIPGYTIISKLGDSDVSSVWQAKQESLNRVVSIKILKRKYASNQSDVDRFVSEAKMLAKLKSPHTIQIYDIGRYEDTFFIVMEYLDRRTLKEALESDGPLPQKQALMIAAAVVDALAEAWKVGKIFHGDVKPQNIMLERDGGIKIANLGLVRILNEHSEKSAGIDKPDEIPYYISPEQARGEKDVDYRSDMYSLGAVLYHMVTGQPPFAGKNKKEIMSAHERERIAHPCDVNPAITPGCSQIITRLMMKGPGYRFKEWDTVYKDRSVKISHL